MSRTINATIDVQTYTIPDIWIVGYCTSNKCSTVDAIYWWHYQSTLERRTNEAQR